MDLKWEKAANLYAELISNNGCIVETKNNTELFQDYKDIEIREYVDFLASTNKIKIISTYNKTSVLYACPSVDSPFAFSVSEIKKYLGDGKEGRYRYYVCCIIFFVFLTEIVVESDYETNKKCPIYFDELFKKVNDYFSVTDEEAEVIDEEVGINFSIACKAWNSLPVDGFVDETTGYMTIKCKKGLLQKCMRFFCRDEVGLISYVKELNHYLIEEKLFDFLKKGVLDIDRFNEIKNALERN